MRKRFSSKMQTLKKLLSSSLAVIMALSMTLVPVPKSVFADEGNPELLSADELPPTGEVKPGLYINNTIVNPEAWSGAIIVTGTNESEWPFAKPASSGEAAFTPEAGQEYRLTATITSLGAPGIRVRWVKDATGSNSSYTADSSVVNSHIKAANETATVIPVYFQNTLSNGDTKGFVTEFVMDGSASADGLIGNITIRGQGGDNKFSVDAIKIEKMNTTAADEVLLEWDKDDEPEEVPPPVNDGYIKEDPYTGFDLGDGLQNIHLASLNMESWKERATPLDNRILNSGNSTFEVISNPFGEGSVLKINYDYNGLTTFGGISLEGYFDESITIPEGALIEYDLYYPKSVASKLMRLRIKVGSAANVDPYLRALDTTNLNPDWQDYYMGETWLRNQTSVSAQAGSGNNFILELHGETARPAESTAIIVANIRILQPDSEGIPLPLIVNTKHNSEVTPLKDKYNAEDSFMVGAIGTGAVTGTRANHYTIFVAGNSLKAEATHPNGPNWLTDIDGNALANATTNPGLAEYNMPTAEYKAVRDSGEPGEYKLHGHVLAWYNQAPGWMRQIVPVSLQSGYTDSVNFYGLGNGVTTQVKVDADMAKRVQYNHTMYVMRHFLTTDDKYGSSTERGIIPFNSWDVLNEEVHETRFRPMIEEDPNSWRESLKHTNWLVAMSDDAINGDLTDHYIYLLFKYAHIAAPNARMAAAYKANYDSLPDYMKLDGHDSEGSIDTYVTDAPPKLTYNDYDTNNKAKARTVYNMVKELNTVWLSDPLYDGRPLIEDLGIQGHDSVGPTLATDSQYAVALYASLADEGLLNGISFSEFDLKYPPTAPGGGALAPVRLNVKQSDTLGYQYALMYKMFTNFAPYIDHIMSWGVQGEGWGSSYVLFDENGNANAGYYGAMDPDRYINGHSYLNYYFEGEYAALAKDYDIDLGDLGVYNIAKGGMVSGNEPKPEPKPNPGGGEEPGGITTGGGGYSPSAPAQPSNIIKNTDASKTIQDAIKNNKTPEIVIDSKSKGVEVDGKDLIASNGVEIKNDQVKVSITPGVINDLGIKETSKLEIVLTPNVKAVDKAMSEKLNALDKANQGLESKIVDLGIKVDGKSVEKTRVPVKVTVDVSKLNLSAAQKDKFTGVLFDKDLKSYVKLGGEFSADGKSFSFYTYDEGKVGTIIVDKVNKLKLTIDSKSVVVNGKVVNSDVAPVIVDNRTLVPLRIIAENLGADIAWDPDTATVTVIKDGKIVSLVIGEALPGGMGMVQIIDDRTYVPVRYILEQLGANVVWDEATRSVAIYQ